MPKNRKNILYCIDKLYDYTTTKDKNDSDWLDEWLLKNDLSFKHNFTYLLTEPENKRQNVTPLIPNPVTQRTQSYYAFRSVILFI